MTKKKRKKVVRNFWRENRNFFPKKCLSSPRKIFRPPKLGARSPPMLTSAVHDPTTSFNPILIHSNTTPRLPPALLHGRREPRRAPGQTFLRAPRLFNIISAPTANLRYQSCKSLDMMYSAHIVRVRHLDRQ